MLTATEHASVSCPICLGTKWQTGEVLRLYGVRVCRRCYYRLANRRQIAFIIDLILLWVFQSAISAGIFMVANTAGMFLDVLMLLLTFAAIALFSLKDGFSGHSPGKWLCGLQVLKADSLEPIGFRTSFLRNVPILAIQGSGAVGQFLFPLAALIWRAFVLIAFLIMAYQLNRGPRWGDGLAGTKVIWKALRHRPPFDTRGLLCINCGYDLRGTVSGICSECGTPVERTPA